MKSLFLSLFLISFSFTQVFSSYDYVGSKATAMSGDVTSWSGGSWSMLHNPAQLADLSGIHFVNGYSRIYNLDFLPYYNMGISYNSYSVSFQKLSTEINDTELSSENVTNSETKLTLPPPRDIKLSDIFHFILSGKPI